MTRGESPPHVLTHVAPGCRNVTTLYCCKLPRVYLEIKSHLHVDCHTAEIWLLDCDLQHEWGDAVSTRFSMLQEELKARCEVSVNRSMLADVSLKATTTISVVWQQQWLLWDGSLHTGCSFTNLVIQILHQKYTMSKYYQSSWRRGRWGEGYCGGYTLWCG